MIYDRKQINEAKAVLRNKRKTNLSKPESILLLKQSGMTMNNICKIILENHTVDELNCLTLMAIRINGY